MPVGMGPVIAVTGPTAYTLRADVAVSEVDRLADGTAVTAKEQS